MICKKAEWMPWLRLTSLPVDIDRCRMLGPRGRDLLFRRLPVRHGCLASAGFVISCSGNCLSGRAVKYFSAKTK